MRGVLRGAKFRHDGEHFSLSFSFSPSMLSATALICGRGGRLLSPSLRMTTWLLSTRSSIFHQTHQRLSTHPPGLALPFLGKISSLLAPCVFDTTHSCICSFFQKQNGKSLSRRSVILGLLPTLMLARLPPQNACYSTLDSPGVLEVCPFVPFSTVISLAHGSSWT